MNGNTAIVTIGAEQMGAMVRSGSSLFVYWRCEHMGPVAIVVRDLSGLPPQRLLDGSGTRRIEPGDGQGRAYVDGLLPGHLYHVTLCARTADGDEPILSAGPVQTPWHDLRIDEAAFPSPYYRS